MCVRVCVCVCVCDPSFEDRVGVECFPSLEALEYTISQIREKTPGMVIRVLDLRNCIRRGGLFRQVPMAEM